MKVLVSCGKELKFVFPVKDANIKVEHLVLDIAARAKRLLGYDENDKSVEFVEVRLGEYALMPYDIVSQVIGDNDHLQLVDKKQQMEERLPKLNRPALTRISRTDCYDNTTRHISIGTYSNLNYFYVLCEENRTPLRLEIFSFHDINDFPKSGSFAIMDCSSYFTKKEGAVGTPHAQCSFIVKENETIASAVELSISSSTDPRPEIKRIPLILEGSKIKLGAAIDVQSAQVDMWKEFADVPLPCDESLGDTHTNDGSSLMSLSGDLEIETSSIFTGEIPLKISLNDDIYVCQTWIDSDGKVIVTYAANFHVTNNTDKPVIISTPKTSYFSRDLKSWVEAKGRLGRKDGYARYAWNDNDYRIESNSTGEVSIGMIISDLFVGTQGNTARLTPKVLGQPFYFKIELEDTVSHSSSIILRQENEKWQPEITNNNDSIFSFHIINFDTHTTHPFIICKKEYSGREYLDVQYKSGNSHYLYYDDLIAIAFKASQAGESIVKLDQMSMQDEQFIIKQEVYALVDLKHNFVYALKIQNSVYPHSTSQTRYFRIPPRYK